MTSIQIQLQVQMGKGRHVRTVLLAYSGRTAGGLAAARTNQGTRTHAGEGCAPVCVLATPHPVASQRPRARSPARALQPRSMHARGARALQPRGARGG